MDGGKVRFIALIPDQSLGRAYKNRVNAGEKANKKGAHGWHARLLRSE
jgi:hypothetical protein